MQNRRRTLPVTSQAKRGQDNQDLLMHLPSILYKATKDSIISEIPSDI